MPFLAALLAAGIFSADTFSSTYIAIAVLYVAVILMAVSFCSRTGLLLVAVGCAGLTLLSYLWTHSIFDDDGALLRCIVSLSAITITGALAVRIHAATATLASQARLLSLTHDAIVVYDMDGVISYWNRGAEELYGWTSQEAAGQQITALLQTGFPQAFDTIRAQLVQDGRWDGILNHQQKTGNVVTVSSRWSLERDDRGRPLSVLEVNTDITDRMKAEEALNTARAELAHVNRVMTLGELTASIAHEVNQPLTAITTNGEAALRWLSRAAPDLEEAKAAIGQVVSQGRRASDVIGRLRALTKKAPQVRAPLTLNEVIEETLPLMESQLLQQRIDFSLSLAESPLEFPGDKIQLQQVMINLLANALQAMAGQPGRRRAITVRTALTAEGDPMVAVTDSGPGISQAAQDRLFDAFYTTKASGTGMGLSICRSIVEAHGGRIWVAETSPEGTTMAFFVSLAAPAP